MTAARSAHGAGLVIGAGLDLLFSDPAVGHPVAAFGRAASLLEARVWADGRLRGALYALGCAGAAAGAGALLHAVTRGTRGRVVVVAAATWAVLGATSLAREGRAMQALLDDGDLPAARSRLAHLCGRDASELDEAELARATVESLAENTSDAVVAPLLWGAAAGVPGLLGYRAVNTLDAMVGHRSARYARFGWAAARLDDLANLVPARVTGLLAALLAPLVGGSSHQAWRTMRRDGSAHPSPNAGVCEAAFAGALGVRLGGANRYAGWPEVRGPLGDGRPPGRADIGRAVRLSRVTGLAAVAVAALLAVLRPGRASA